MIIIDTVTVLDNEQIAVIILIHKEEFPKFIVMRDRISTPIQTVQSIVRLNPVYIIPRIYDIINQISG